MDNNTRTNYIQVFNYNDHGVSFYVAPHKAIYLERAEDGIPTSVSLTFEEILYANNNNIFTHGILEFDSEVEDDIYADLGINKDKVLKYNDIKDILLNPTEEGLIKLIRIDNVSNFDRVRGIFYKLSYLGYDLTLNVRDIVNTRFDELLAGKVHSSLIERVRRFEPEVNKSALESEVANLAETVRLLQEQLLLAQQQNIKVEEHADEKSDKVTEKSSTKKVTSKPKKQGSKK